MALSRSVQLSLVCVPAIAVYWLVFLRQPIVEGASEFTRAAFVLNTLLLPESIVSTWTGSGRLSPGWLDRCPIIAHTLAWLALAVMASPVPMLSMPLRGAHKPRMAQRLFDLSLAALAGLAILSTVTLLVGLSGGLASRVPLAVAIVVTLLITYFIRNRHRSWTRPRSDEAPTSLASLNTGEFSYASKGTFDRALGILAIGIAIFCGLVIMLGAWVPPAEFDVIEYHLQAPKEFYQQGRIDFVPHNVYANMPLGVEMHALAAMTLWPEPYAWYGGMVGKSISAAISLIGACLLGSWLSMRYDKLIGWWSAGIWLATPGIAHVATQGLIDGALATYCLASALCVCELIGSSQGDHGWPQVVYWSTLASLLGGATAAIKYPGLIFATLPCLLAVGWSIGIASRTRAPSRNLQALLGITGLSLLVTCVPWYAKNWWLAGNPVYPLAANLFGGQTLTPEKIAQWGTAHKVPPATNLLGDVARVAVTSSFVQPAMILGLVVASASLISTLRSSNSRRMQQSMLVLVVWSVWLLAVWWLATHRIDRFWLPITGLWAGLAAWGVMRVRLTSVWLAHALVIPGLIYGALINCSPIVGDNRYFVSLAALSNDMGDQNTPPRVPLAQGWINNQLANTPVKILLIGEARIFEYRVPVLYSTCFDTNPGETLLAGKSAAAQHEALVQAGITHIMINWAEIERYRSPGNYGFSKWPQPSDIEAMIAADIVKRVQWDLGKDRADLLEVKPLIAD